MNSIKYILALGSLLCGLTATAIAQDVAKFYEKNAVLNYSDGEKAAGDIEQPTQFDPNFHIYLCFGQSNMEGNAKIESQDRQGISTRFRMMSAVDMPNIGRERGKWYAAVPPLCREWTGLTPADYFGRTLVEQLPEEVKVGIVHVAVGGASIDLFDEDKTADVIEKSADWFKNFCKEYDNNPYRRLIECAKEAQKAGVIKGILLHQGCTDNNQQDWPQRVNVIYQRILKELNLKAQDVPLLVGELMTQEDGGCCFHHNAIIDRIHEEIPTAYAVSSYGCPGRPDKLHFTAEGYRIIGRRYAEVMLSLLNAEDEQPFEVQTRTVEEGGTGSYPAVMAEVRGFKEHTVFYPRNLAAFDAQHPLPVLVWGNGACSNSPWEHYLFLNEIASHGYLVIATGNFPVDDTPYQGPMSTPQQQTASIDWALKQNLDPASPLYHKINTRAICAAGMSCGGLQTLFNCADSRITSYMICNSGLFMDPSIAMPGMPMPGKDQLQKIHAPILYMLGGPEDIAYQNGMDDFHRIQHVPAFAINYPVGHGGTYRQPHGGEFSYPAIAWLDWQLKGDNNAAHVFVGTDARLKQRKDWTLECNTLAQTIQLPAPTPLLHTTVAQGEIEGELHEGFALYRAIPYAEAPVGNLRWKKPVPKRPWQGVLKAEKWGDRPWQTPDPNQGGADLGMSEDCLYLSVETPAISKDEKLPVFVMIHGGGFSTGTYSGTQESFVREGIVYCSVEYRLGALGFMAHPELAKESTDGLSGNYGIYDQICALQWIHDNIAQFGGDPDRVTICGESAGGISVSILCASPLCKGLFRGAISESGGNFCPVNGTGFTSMKDHVAAMQQGKDFQQKLAVKNLKKLRQVNGEELVKATQGTQFWPIVDGVAIVDDQYKLYEEGKYNDVDVLIGYNSDEGSLFIYQMQLDAYKGMMNAQYGSKAADLLKVYPANTDQEALYAMQDMFRDTAFGWSTWAWANLQSRTGKGNVYMYYFAQPSQNSLLKNSRGATHVAEMPFVYGWNWGPMTETETHMAQIIPQYWINFTKTGNPNADSLPYWTPYRQGEPTVMNMHNGLSLILAPNEQQMNFWEQHFKSLRK